MFKKLLASVGIGGAKVDTILHTDQLRPGEAFSGEIKIMGGDVDQEISGLDLALMTQAKQESDDSTFFVNHAIQTWRLSEKRTLKAKEELVIPFEFVLHPETPITQIAEGRNQSVVWLQTGLDIDLAVDAQDKDLIYTYPNEAVQAFMTAMDNLGYQLFKADVEKGYLRTQTFQSNSGCYQEIEYKPGNMSMMGVKEVELSFVPEADRTHVLIEIDRAFRGDGYVATTIEHDDISLEAITENLRAMLG